MLAGTAVAVMFLYSDYSALALIGAQVLWLWLERREHETSLYPWLAAALVVGIAFLPLVPNLLLKAAGGGTLADLAGDPRGYILRIVYPAFSYTFGETILPWHVTVLIASALLALAYIALARASQIRRLTAFLLWQLLACLGFNVLVFSTVAADLPFVTIASRSMFVLPVYLLLLASAVACLPTFWRSMATVGLLLANFAALFNLFAGVEYHNPIFAVPVREVAAAVAQGSRPGDVVISDYDTSFFYYWDQSAPRGVEHYLTEPEELPQAEDAVASGAHPHVWLLVYGRDRSRDIDHTPTFEALLAPRYTLVAERGYAPVDDLYRLVKSKLIGREAYAYKLLVREYERKP